MNKYPDFWHVIFGNGHTGTFLGLLVMAYISAMVSIMIDISTRDVSSKNTPEKLSWRFFAVANLARIAANLLLIPLFIRLVYEYANPTLMLFITIGIGLGVDRLALLAKNFGILTTNKLASRITDKLNEPDSSPKN